LVARACDFYDHARLKGGVGIDDTVVVQCAHSRVWRVAV
jgi:hypothetical protein